MVNPQNTFCCLNPDCPHPLNPKEAITCLGCNTPLTLLDNRYRPIKFLGEGGFGRTYLAEDTRRINKKDCVIKQLAPKNLGTYTNLKAIDLFRREAEQLESLGEHPQIPRLLAYLEQDNYFYLVQQYINGQTLDKLRDRRWNEVEIREFLKNILPVLQFIHEHKVIHRDIKPQNIMYSQDEANYILIDFGVSKEFASTVHIRATITGTRGYAAYEQLDRGEAVPASDLFSIGATCFYLLTHKDPYYLLLEDGYKWVNRWQTHLPHPISPLLTNILDKLLKKERRNRYQSAQEVLEELNLTKTPQNKPGFWPKLFNPTKDNQSPSSKTSGQTPLPSTHLSLSPTPDLKTFSFTTVKLDPQGNIIKRETKQAQFLGFDLGKGIILEMVKIPGGTLVIGSPPSEEARGNNEQQHQITLSDFYIGKYLITQEQWQLIMGNNPSSFKKGEKYPVEQVSWYNCQEFCQKLSDKTGLPFRLPAEAEWEYACRATSLTQGEARGEQTPPFYFGATLSTEVANYNGNYTYGSGQVGIYREETTKVGSFPPNGFGLYDMHGNLWEWCQDEYQENPSFKGQYAEKTVQSLNESPKKGDQDLNYPLMAIDQNSQFKLLRGGSWDNIPSSCRCSYRNWNAPEDWYDVIGFRVVLAKT